MNKKHTKLIHLFVTTAAVLFSCDDRRGDPRGGARAPVQLSVNYLLLLTGYVWPWPALPLCPSTSHSGCLLMLSARELQRNCKPIVSMHGSSTTITDPQQRVTLPFSQFEPSGLSCAHMRRASQRHLLSTTRTGASTGLSSILMAA